MELFKGAPSPLCCAMLIATMSNFHGEKSKFWFYNPLIPLFPNTECLFLPRVWEEQVSFWISFANWLCTDTKEMLLKIVLLEEKSLKSCRILVCINSSTACQKSGNNLSLLLGSGLTLVEYCLQSLQFKINVKKF